jgi:hypothetical protein
MADVFQVGSKNQPDEKQIEVVFKDKISAYNGPNTK